MKELVMENFEEAIAPFVKKVYDKKSPEQFTYEMVRNPRKITYKVTDHTQETNPPRFVATLNDKRIYGTPGRAVITPAGRFDTLKLAAAHYGISNTSMWNRINKHRGIEKKEYYYEEGNEC